MTQRRDSETNLWKPVSLGWVPIGFPSGIHLIVENTIGKEGNRKPPYKIHFTRKKSEPCLRFLLSSKLSIKQSLFFTLIFESNLTAYQLSDSRIFLSSRSILILSITNCIESSGLFTAMAVKMLCKRIFSH